MQYSVADYILDITSNSIEAGASKILLSVEETGEKLTVLIKDNGSGMDSKTIKKALDPFYTDAEKHPSRKVGLGLPFLIQAVELTGEQCTINSQPGKGTEVSFSFNQTSIDAPPIGDFAGAFRSLLLYSGNYDLVIDRKKETKSYRVSRKELYNTLGDFTDTESLMLIKQFFMSNEEELNVQ